MCFVNRLGATHGLQAETRKLDAPCMQIRHIYMQPSGYKDETKNLHLLQQICGKLLGLFFLLISMLLFLIITGLCISLVLPEISSCVTVRLCGRQELEPKCRTLRQNMNLNTVLLQARE